MEQREVYSLDIAGVRRDLPLFEVKPGMRIAILNILGDVELVDACATALATKLADKPFDVIITAEAKSIPIAHELAKVTQKPYVVLRKEYKPYMGEALKAETLSITTGKPQNLFLDEKDIKLLKDKQILLLDDVFASLDYRTQNLLVDNLREMEQGRTTLIVSQRVAAVAHARFILVFDAGRICEQGTHQELIDRRGLYYKLYEQQLALGDGS